MVERGFGLLTERQLALVPFLELGRLFLERRGAGHVPCPPPHSTVQQFAPKVAEVVSYGIEA